MTWLISPQERQKYDQIFDGLPSTNGLLSGEKVKPILLNSKLPVDVLVRVWELSDMDVDGFLDKDEFAVAMHLVYRALEKVPIPLTLPPELIPPSKVRAIGGSLPIMAPMASFHPPAPLDSNFPLSGVPASFPHSINGSPVQQIVITPAEKQQYDEMFRNADLDLDGYVNGAEIKDVFLQSGLPQLVLAHIWSLCDVNTIGKLNCDQYALAMHFIQQKLKGVEPPPHLLPENIPQILKNVMIEKSTMSLAVSKEIESLTQEIAAIKQEKLQLEQEKAQKVVDERLSFSEVANLQKELDAYVATIKQLETQKGEAQKRLNILDDKIEKLESNLIECKEKYKDDQKQIEQLRYQITHRDVNSSNEEEEIGRMQEEIAGMQKEEVELEAKLNASMLNKKELNLKLSELQKCVAQTNISIDSYRKVQEELTNSVSQYEAVLNGSITEDQLNLSPITLPSDSLFKNTFDSKFTNNSTINPSLFSNNLDVSDVDPFATADPFAVAVTIDPFENDMFKDAFEIQAKPSSLNATDLFETDPFQNNFDFQAKSGSKNASPFLNTSANMTNSTIDPWGASNLPIKSDLDIFDPFASSFKTEEVDANSDPFGASSFFPTSRGVGGPMLPPKQKKAAAPPRPPAPRPNEAFVDPFNPAPHFQPKASSKKSQGMPKFKSEAEQLAWVKRESEAEFQQQKRLREKEQSDLELALALSQKET